MRRWLKKYVDPWIPLYYICPGCFGFLVNCLIYYGGQWVPMSWKHWDMTTDLERTIPLQSGWIVVYFLFFAFAGYHYLLVAHYSRKETFRLNVTDILSRLVCALFFLFLPTTNVRPNLKGQHLAFLLRMTYAADRPVNLFPSIHCLVSWLCFISIRRLPNLPRWHKVLTLIGAVLICLSTLFVKQHVIADVVGGIALAEGMYFLTIHTRWPERMERWMEVLSGKIFGRENVSE